jgi:hypothetical protein
MEIIKEYISKMSYRMVHCHDRRGELNISVGKLNLLTYTKIVCKKIISENGEEPLRAG